MAHTREALEMACKAQGERDEARDQLRKVESDRSWLLSAVKWVYTILPATPAEWLQSQVSERLGLDLSKPAPDTEAATGSAGDAPTDGG